MKTKYTNVLILNITIDNIKFYNQFKNVGVTLILFDKSSNSDIWCSSVYCVYNI